MKLDHVNLTVQDVLTASAFIKKHFGYTDMFDDNSEHMAVLTDGSDMHINLLNDHALKYMGFRWT